MSVCPEIRRARQGKAVIIYLPNKQMRRSSIVAIKKNETGIA
jgi:hypothetical protein